MPVLGDGIIERKLAPGVHIVLDEAELTAPLREKNPTDPMLLVLLPLVLGFLEREVEGDGEGLTRRSGPP